MVELGFAVGAVVLCGLCFQALSARRRRRRRIMLQLLLAPVVLHSYAAGEFGSFCSGVRAGAASSFR